MIKLDGKVVADCGWAGPLLWISTKDNYAIHLYDAPVFLNRTRVKAPHDLNSKLAGQRINGVEVNEDNFCVRFESGMVLKVASFRVETARIFKKGVGRHWIYKAGALQHDA